MCDPCPPTSELFPGVLREEQSTEPRSVFHPSDFELLLSGNNPPPVNPEWVAVGHNHDHGITGDRAGEGRGGATTTTTAREVVVGSSSSTTNPFDFNFDFDAVLGDGGNDGMNIPCATAVVSTVERDEYDDSALPLATAVPIDGTVVGNNEQRRHHLVETTLRIEVDRRPPPSSYFRPGAAVTVPRSSSGTTTRVRSRVLVAERERPSPVHQRSGCGRPPPSSYFPSDSPISSSSTNPFEDAAPATATPKIGSRWSVGARAMAAEAHRSVRKTLANKKRQHSHRGESAKAAARKLTVKLGKGSSALCWNTVAAAATARTHRTPD